MAFISYNPKEDMQNETFQAVTAYLLQTVEARRQKNLQESFDYLDSLWTLIHSRINDPAIGEAIEKLNNQIYSPRELTEQESNKLLDEVRTVQRQITASLENKGLLFRMRGKPGELVTMG